MLLTSTISALALFTSSTSALPWPGKQPQTYTPSSDLSQLAKLMPTSALPTPSGQLKYVVLGIGTQNYTCTSGNPDAAPGTTGALAALYDIGTPLSHDPLAKYKIPSLSPLMLALSSFPSALSWSLQSQSYSHRIGTHEFRPLAGANTPTFAFDALPAPWPVAQVAKANDTAAPESACPGLTGEGTVKWLLLKDAGTSQGGVDEVYRVETAGGMPPATCRGRPERFEVKYVAQYWIFGPKK